MKQIPVTGVPFPMRLAPFPILLLATCAAAPMPATESGPQVAPANVGRNPAVPDPAVPPLESLASDWHDTGALLSMPAASNFIGGLQVTDNLTAFSTLTEAPLFQGGVAATLKVGGQPLKASAMRWSPLETRRKAEVDGVAFSSALRMVIEEPVVLLDVVLENRADAPRTLDLTLDTAMMMDGSSATPWQWDPRPLQRMARPGAISADRRLVTVAAKAPAAPAACAFSEAPDAVVAGPGGGTAAWKITLAPGTSRRLAFAIAAGKDADMKAARAADGFNAAFDAVETGWVARWKALFTPGNAFFSGHLPVLKTDDKAIARVYYQGALVPLLMCRTNLPAGPRCFVSSGPFYGNTLTFFWDSDMWANGWAMLDPAGMRAMLVKWMALDAHRFYALECISGQGSGRWYAANSWSLIRCIEAYLDVTGDTTLLAEKVDGKTVLERVDALATLHEANPLPVGAPLADFGASENLLECAPTYIEGVPSLNAAAVYLMRKTAVWQEAAGNPARAAELRVKAEKLLPAVLGLYEPGQGVWNAMNRRGAKVPLRHCYDYIVVGQALADDLAPTVKREMTEFVERELMTEGWMRAMSVKDPSTAKSNRPDHGPLGSYDGWPPMTMDVMCGFGTFDKATRFYRSIEPVTHLGPFSQAHELVGPGARGRNAIVKTARRGAQSATAICGASFAEVLIHGLFGVRTGPGGKGISVLNPGTPRGFAGELRHLPWQGRLYTVKSSETGVEVAEEK